NRPLSEVAQKLASMRKAILLIGQLNATLDMERGGQIAENLRALYEYILVRLTLANAENDTRIVDEASDLLRKIKTGWDGIVTDAR
ncbi:MAG: fliS, partial [Gammaproteobacteria bacterium]|nr:fliS [Gammaproteobacteria bacterium]